MSPPVATSRSADVMSCSRVAARDASGSGGDSRMDRETTNGSATQSTFGKHSKAASWLGVCVSTVACQGPVMPSPLTMERTSASTPRFWQLVTPLMMTCRGTRTSRLSACSLQELKEPAQDPLMAERGQQPALDRGGRLAVAGRLAQDPLDQAAWLVCADELARLIAIHSPEERKVGSDERDAPGRQRLEHPRGQHAQPGQQRTGEHRAGHRARHLADHLP